jgi:hypothetical protein
MPKVTTKSKTRVKKSKRTAREITYPEYRVDLRVGPEAITADEMKEILGWSVVPEPDPEANGEEVEYDVLLTDREGNEVYCTNNPINRPFYKSTCEQYVQELLNGKWQFNGEPLVISETGVVLSGQHTGVALILAEQDRKADSKRWGRKPITMDRVIVYGVSEKDEVVNTLDTGRPRTLADAVYRCDVLSDVRSKKERKEIAGAVGTAISVVWDRTDVATAFDLAFTHSEALAFFMKHPSILKASTHVIEEATDTTLTRKLYLRPGYAAGLLFLMGTCKSDPGKYYESFKSRSEDKLDLSMWETAEDYFTDLLGQGKKTRAVLTVMSDLCASPDEDALPVPVSHRMAIVIKGWERWLKGKSIKEEHLEVECDNVDDKLVMFENPVCGGIDLGVETEEPDEEEVESVEEAKEKKRKEAEARIRESGGDGSLE